MKTNLDSLTPHWRIAPVLCSVAALGWVVAARVLGPCDLWDQTQPKTVSYTTDILVHGGRHWILPVERGEEPATKPPLYNWLAVPGVALLGFGSELAHKLPSAVALCLTWLLLVRLGRRLDPQANEKIGWLAGLIVLSNYPMFKLGYLARPDMVLIFFMLMGWMMCTALLLDGANEKSHRQSSAVRRCVLVCGFWLSVAFAALTKGPPAILLVIYAVLTARFIAGSWGAVRRIAPVPGILFSLAVGGGWVYAVWLIDPVHLREELWFAEIYGRFTGTGPKSGPDTPAEWITDLPDQILYYLIRFIPWSLFSIAAMVELWKQARRGEKESSPGEDSAVVNSECVAWMRGAAIFVILVVAVFTVSIGKRADYIAVAYPQGAVLAAWWLMRVRPRWGVTVPWLAPTVAAIALTTLTIVNEVQPNAPVDGFGKEISRFIDAAGERIADQPMPVAFLWTGKTHLQAMLGDSSRAEVKRVRALLDSHERVWVFAGRRADSSPEFEEWVQNIEPRAEVHEELRSSVLPRAYGWPEQITMYRVERGSSAGQ